MHRIRVKPNMMMSDRSSILEYQQYYVKTITIPTFNV